MKTLMPTPARAAAIPIATVSSTVQRMSRLATWARPTPSPINSMSVITPDTMRACGNGRFDVLEVWGHIYKADYRMRLIYAQIKGSCALMGQEILEASDPF
jgi:hypothetical protein